MKNRDILIDFTSLLDVTLIIIFFFIMFSSFETDTEKKKAVSEAQQTLAEAESKLEEANELHKQADEALAELAKADERGAENIDAILDFSQNKNLKLNLKKNIDNWALEVFQNTELLKNLECSSQNELENSFKELLTAKSITNNDTILCEFFFNASEPGSHKAYETVAKVFESLRKSGYEHLYYSETDLSIIGGNYE